MGSYSGGAGRSFFEYISQVVVYPAGFLVVGELDIKHFDEAVTQVGNKEGTTIVMVTHSQHDAGYADLRYWTHTFNFV